MPLIIVEGPRMDTDTKRELARSIAEAVSRVTGHRKEIITTVIHENEPANVAPGGELLVDKWAREGGGRGAGGGDRR